MKQLKNWSILMFMVMAMPLNAYSQDVDIDERDLVGTWNRVEAQGEFDLFPYPSPPVKMRFKDANSHYADSVAVYYYEEDDFDNVRTHKYGACDYFISKNNILHFIPSGSSSRASIRFKIISFSGNKLTLETFSGKGTLVLAKEVPTNVRALKDLEVSDDKYYTLDGKQLQAAPSQGIYINKKKKYIK